MDDQTSEAKAVTGRPNDLEIVEQTPALPNSTFGSRAKKAKTVTKAVDDDQAENKAVSSARTKRK